MNEVISEGNMLDHVDDWLLSHQIPMDKVASCVPNLLKIYNDVFSDIDSKLALAVQKSTSKTETPKFDTNKSLKFNP